MLTATANAPALPANRLGKAGTKQFYLAKLLGLLLLLAPMLLKAQDRNQAINMVYPDSAFTDKGGHIINITKPPYNAKGDGVTDDTQAFIAAYDFVTSEIVKYGWGGAAPRPNGSYIIYVPNGTYLVSNTLIYSGDTLRHPTGFANAEALVWIRFIGQSRANTIIKLKDNAPGFGEGASKPVVSYGKTDFNNLAGQNTFRNITINTGKGNPGAIGIKFVSANSGSMEQVTVKSEDGRGRVGLEFFSTVHGYYHDITVDGFDYGVRVLDFEPTAFSMEYLTVRNQDSAGVHFVEGPGSIRLMRSENSVPAVLLSKGGGHGVITDSRFVGGASSNPAIQIKAGHLFARNITIAGYGSTVKKGSTIAATGHVTEYVSDSVYKFSDASPATSLNLPVKDVPQVPWGDPATDWANVNNYPGATATEKIQNALNSGKSTIYFPNKFYSIDAPLTIPATVKRINVMYATFSGSASPKFKINENASDPLLIHDLHMQASASVGVAHNAPRTLILDNFRHNGPTYVNNNTDPNVEVFFNVSAGGVFKNMKFWGRFLNQEATAGPQFLADNCTMWLHGFKTEKGVTAFKAFNNAKLEVLGGAFNQYGTGWPTTEYVIVNENAQVSIVACSNGGGGRFYENIVKDTQGTATKTLVRTDFPERIGLPRNFIVPLYVSHKGSYTSITGFTLINTETQAPIAGFDPIPDNAVLDFTKLDTTKLSIRANTFPQQVDRVVFDYDGTTSYSTDNAFPYALAGNDHETNAYLSWTPALGEHVLTATPYAGSDATSLAGTGSSLRFSVTNSVQNLAVGKPVTATSAQAAYPAELAVDDDVTTRWTAGTWPVWLEVDLGQVYLVEKTQLFTHANRSYRYKIEVSTDGTTYQHLNKTTLSEEAGLFTDSFAPLAARYVRVKLLEDEVEITGKEKDGWVSLAEFRVFGKTMLDAPPAPAPEGSIPKGVETKVADFFSLFRLYPNPAQGVLRVEYLASEAGQVHIRLLAMSGRGRLIRVHQAVKGANTFQIDVSALPLGVYVVQLQGAGLPLVKKLVIAR